MEREYSNIIEQARERIREYTREIDSKQRAIFELEQQTTVCQQSLQLIQQNLQEKEQEKNRLDGEIAKRQENLAGFNNLINEALKISPEDRMALSNAELAKLKQQIEHNKSELSYLKEKYQEVKEEKQEIQTAISQQEESVHQLKALLAELNARKVETTEEINSLQTKYQQLQEEFIDLRNKKESLECRILEIGQKNPNLLSLEQLQGDIEKLVSEKQALTRQIVDFNSQVEDLITKKEALAEIPPKLEKAKIELSTVTQKVISQQAALEDLKSQDRQLRQEREKLEIDAQNYKQQLNEAKAEIVIINAQKEQLVETNNFLANRKQELEREISLLRDREQELERRIAVIEKANPHLDTLEELQKQIGQIRIEKSELEGEKEALASQVGSLEIKRAELPKIEAQLSTKQIELEKTISEVARLKDSTKDLEKQATELELLRVTYDALSSEKDSFEARINQLNPEIAGLEVQKQQILQAIQESEEKYRQIEQQRQESHRLRLEIRQQQHEISNLEREARQVTGIVASSEEEKARLEQDNHKLEQRLKMLKGEIKEIENSAALALQALRKPLWLDLPQTNRQIDPTATGEQQFILGFANHLAQQGLTFPERVINAFHTSLKVQDISALVILAGISGTGKSELPQRYAEYIGAQQLTLAVQPRWDSSQDLQGFYNYIEKKYKPTDLMRGLYQYQNDSNMSDRLVIVLLDEMNLARVEYYFSDFLSKLESRRSGATYLDLDVGSLALPEPERKLAIPQQFLFVGTMNEDETTQSLSDKVLDRANVLTFGKPQQLKLREEAQSHNTSTSVQGYVSYSQFQDWMRSPDLNSEFVTKLREYLNRANVIMDKLGHPFAHRVYQAITRYVVNYPGVVEGNKSAFNAALADQFGQKLLPKLRGLMLDECRQQLEDFSQLINEIGDPALIQAFATASDGHFGQFHWRGFVYLEESEQVLSPVGR